MNLYKAEFRRLVRRRLAVVFGLCAAAGLLLVSGAMLFTSTNDPSPQQIAYAEEQAEITRDELERCKADEAFFEDEWGYDAAADYPGATHEEVCDEVLGWGTEPADHYTFYTFGFAEDGVEILIGLAIVTGLLAMMLAASGIGAEWSSGGMANLLVWHPNRMKVWGAKLAASLSLTAAALVVITVAGFGLLYAAASATGEIGELDALWWEEATARLGRTGVLALGMTLLGAALAMLGRHTAIAGGVIAGYLIIGNNLLVHMLGFALEVAFPDRFSLYVWVSAWIEGRIELVDWSQTTGFDAEPATMVLTSTHAGLLLGGILLLCTALATWAFAKRDVA